MDFTNHSFEQMARHWFQSICANPSVESFARSSYLFLPCLGFGHLFEFVFILFMFFFYFHISVTRFVDNALIKGEIEDRVCPRDQWMVASLCDE